MNPLLNLTIKDAHDKLISHEITVAELVDAYLEQIKQKNSEINAYLEIYADIEEQVKKAQQKIDEGKATLLTGIPLAIKDNILIKGKRVGAASKILEGYIAPYNATVTDKLDAHTPIYIGRANMDEFAMGGSNETSAYGPVKNPYDTSRVPGGSSGGSAAAVAMRGALAALGSDTGGSIRQPASLTGLVGLKPSYGRVSRYGLMAMASSLDQIGPLTRTVDDAEIIYNAIIGVDPHDATTHSLDEKNIQHTRTKAIGVPFKLIQHGVDPDVRKNFDDMLDVLKHQGYEIIDVDLPSLEYALAVYYVIMPAEASSNLSRFDGVRFGAFTQGKNVVEDYFKTRANGFGKEVRRRIMLGTYVLSSGYYDAYYGKAQQVQALMTKEFNDVFKKVDAILTPTSPTPAFKIGEKTSDPLSMYLADIFTVSANLTRVPAISVPSGYAVRDDIQLPLGIQFMAPHFCEDILFELARVIEKNNKI